MKRETRIMTEIIFRSLNFRFATNLANKSSLATACKKSSKALCALRGRDGAREGEQRKDTRCLSTMRRVLGRRRGEPHSMVGSHQWVQRMRPAQTGCAVPKRSTESRERRPLLLGNEFLRKPLSAAPPLRIIPGWQQGNRFEGASQTTLVNILIVSPTSAHYVGGRDGGIVNVSGVL